MDDSWKSLVEDCGLTASEYAARCGLGSGADEEDVRMNVAIRAAVLAKAQAVETPTHDDAGLFRPLASQLRDAMGWCDESGRYGTGKVCVTVDRLNDWYRIARSEECGTDYMRRELEIARFIRRDWWRRAEEMERRVSRLEDELAAERAFADGFADEQIAAFKAREGLA